MGLNGRSVEGVGLYDVCARFEIGEVDRFDDVGAGEVEDFVVAEDVGGVVGEAVAAIACFVELVRLNE